MQKEIWQYDIWQYKGFEQKYSTLPTSQSPGSAICKEQGSHEGETELAAQMVTEQTGPEGISNPQAEPEASDESELGAMSAEGGLTETRHRQPENEVSEVEIPNVGKILVLSDADGYNEEVRWWIIKA